MVEITTPESQTSQVSEPAGETLTGGTAQAPEGMPSTQGMTSADIAKLAASLSKGGQPTPTSQAAPQVQPPKEVKPQIPRPDKFRNPDGTPNVDNLTKSYTELEKDRGRILNEFQSTKDLLQQQQEQVEYLSQMLMDMQEQAKTQAPGTKKQYSPEEIETIQNDPDAWLEKKLEEKLSQRDSKLKQETSADRLKDYKMLTAMNHARANLPYFRDMEHEIKKLADREWVPDAPEAVEALYYENIGRNMPGLGSMVRDNAYKEGFEAAKKEMGMHVPSGDKGVSSVELALTPESVKSMSAADIAKLLPRGDTGTTKVYPI